MGNVAIGDRVVRIEDREVTAATVVTINGGAAGFQFEVYDALRDGGLIAEDAQSSDAHAIVANALSAIASAARG